MPKKDRLVYSAGPQGASSQRRGAPARTEPTQSLPPERQSPRVRRERAGRKGKTVTVVEPVLLTRGDATTLLGELKRACGGGGALKAGSTRDGKACFVLEIQGDQVERILDLLTAKGYRIKRSGG